MTFEEFYISDKNGKSNEYDDIYSDLCKIANDLKNNSYNDVPVFEKYMEDNNIFKISCEEDIKVKDLKIDNSSYIVFCYNKKDYYHMIPIINNTIYDKNSDCLNLNVISIYRKK